MEEKTKQWYEENPELMEADRATMEDLEIERMRKLLSSGIVEPDFDKGTIERPWKGFIYQKVDKAVMETLTVIEPQKWSSNYKKRR